MAQCFELILVIVFLQLHRILLTFSVTEGELLVNKFKLCSNNYIVLVCILNI